MWYHDESMNVSIVSVSRFAGVSHAGHGTFTHSSCCVSGDLPDGSNSASSGKVTGRSSYGTGTVPQSSQ